MSKRIRSFIAVELDPSIGELIENIQTELKKSNADVKWVNPKQTHLTLKFLGDVPSERIEKIKKILKEVCAKTAVITTEITELGAFPKIDFARVIWLGLKDEEKKLEALAAAIEHALVSLKFPKEKRNFMPHITIGRVRSNKNLRDLGRQLKNYSLPSSLPQTINEIVLFKSTLSSSGPIYEVIEKFIMT